MEKCIIFHDFHLVYYVNINKPMDRKIFTRLIIIYIKKKEIKILIHLDFFQNNLSIEIENSTYLSDSFIFHCIIFLFSATRSGCSKPVKCRAEVP